MGKQHFFRDKKEDREGFLEEKKNIFFSERKKERERERESIFREFN